MGWGSMRLLVSPDRLYGIEFSLCEGRWTRVISSESTRHPLGLHHPLQLGYVCSDPSCNSAIFQLYRIRLLWFENKVCSASNCSKPLFVSHDTCFTRWAMAVCLQPRIFEYLVTLFKRVLWVRASDAVSSPSICAFVKTDARRLDVFHSCKVLQWISSLETEGTFRVIR